MTDTPRPPVDYSGPVTRFPALAEGDSPQEEIARFRRGHVLTVASLFLVDLGTTGILLIVGKRWEVFLDSVALGFAVFGVLGAAGAWLLSRPLVTVEACDVPRMLKRLPLLSASQAVLLALLFCYLAFKLDIFFPDTTRLDALPQGIKIASSLWFGSMYALLYAFFVYFAVSDRCAEMRARIQARTGEFGRAGKGRFLVRLVPVFLFLAVVPATLVGLDLGLFREMRRAQGLAIEQTVLLDVIASLFIIAISLFFVGRSLTRPVRLLAEAQRKLENGDLRAAAPVISDDELGRLTSAFNRMVQGLRERKRLREAFEKYADAHVVEAVMRERAIPPLAREASVLFTDIEGFATIAESMPPEQTFNSVNEYMAVVAKELREHGGVVNNFIGDSVMAVFNVPAELPGHARKAVEAALAVQRLLAERRAHGQFAPATRIGIATGPVYAGVIGDSGRHAYTVYGHTVNLAARLEQANKEFGTAILVSEATSEQARASATCRLEGRLTLKGLAQECAVYSVAPKAAR